MAPSQEFKIGAIAILDILGFKGIWTRRSPKEIIEVMDMSVKLVEALKEDPFFKEITKDIDIEIKVAIISDTIVIECERKNFEEKDFEKIISAMSLIVQAVYFHFLFSNNILIRGAISFGEYFRNEKGNIFMGPAIDDASEWYTKAEWIGAIFTPATTLRIHSQIKDDIEEKLEEKRKDIFIKYPVNCKSINGENRAIELYTVNWPYIGASLLPEGTYAMNETPNKKLEVYKFILDKLSNLNIDSSVFDKYENTIRFAEKCLGIEKNNRMYP